MTKRITIEQQTVVARITQGVRRQYLSDVVPNTTDLLEVNSHEWSRDGSTVIAHRTVLRDDANADTHPRMAFRTELYRIAADGRISVL